MRRQSLQVSDGVYCDLRVFDAANSQQNSILILPAMGVTARHYDGLAKTLCERGYPCAIMELRGLGSSNLRASRTTDFGYRELVKEDIHAAIECMQNNWPQQKITVMGHSLGGQLACLYLAQSERQIDQLILCASCSVYYRGWPIPVRYGLLLFSQICLLISQLCGYLPGHKLGFAGREARGVIRDWARNARSGKYRLSNDTTDYETRLQSVNTAILCINFGNDLFAPVTASRVLIDKMRPTSTDYVCLSGNDIKQPKADHFNWLKSPDKIGETIANWLRQSNA